MLKKSLSFLMISSLLNKPWGVAGLKAIVDNLDDVPENFRELYIPKNGKYEISGIEGLKTQADIDRLQTALTNERKEHKALKDRVSLLGDKKIEEVVDILDRLPELEAAAGNKIDDVKINEIVESRLRSRLAPVERERDKLKKEKETAEAENLQMKSQKTVRDIHDDVRNTVAKIEGFQATALDDVLMYAERMFERTEDGKTVTRDGVGVTPGISPDVWLTEMQTKKPHWWGPSVGANAHGGKFKVPTGVNPWSHDGWNMTEQGKVFAADRVKAEQMAKSAGVPVAGGTRPEKK